MIAFGEAFFVPIFFVSMRISFDIQTLSGVVPFTFLILLIAVGSKIIGCGLGTKLCSYSWQVSLTVGIAMVPRAELALVLARTGYENGVIGSKILAIILLTVIITVLMTPFLLKECGIQELPEN